MSKWFTATDDLAVETKKDMNPAGPGTRVMAGLMKAMVKVYEPGEVADPSLPTLWEFLAKHTDPKSGLVSYDYAGPTLTIDPRPLRQLPPEYLDYRVGPGSSFVTHEALAHFI